MAFSYSDVPHEQVMHRASLSMAQGADFILIGATYTMLRSARPVVAVCASRTGVGKSQTSRAVARILRAPGLKVAAIRHPMPYGDLAKQRVQRFAQGARFLPDARCPCRGSEILGGWVISIRVSCGVQI